MCFPRFSSGDLSVTISAGPKNLRNSSGEKENSAEDHSAEFLLHRLFRAEDRRK